MPAPPPQNDRLLFTRIAEGDEAAFRELYDRYRVRFYAVAFRMTRSGTLAEEIVQEIFITLWLNRSRLPDIQNPGTYFFTMVYNSVRHHFRKMALQQRTHQHAVANEPGYVVEVEQTLDARESRQLIAEAIGQLPPQQQMVYKLSREAGLSREEIARQLGISSHTVRNHLHEALKNIRSHLQQAGSLALIASLLLP